MRSFVQASLYTGVKRRETTCITLSTNVKSYFIISNMAHRSIAKLVKSYHLRAVKSMKFTFDPYSTNVRSIREVLFQMHFPKITATNPGVMMKVDVKSDRSEPLMDVTFVDGHRLLMKTEHLSTLEILDRLWEFCDSKDPKKGEAPALKTKASKAKKR